MDPLTIAAASGMRARLDSLDLLANNLANASTVGYKLDRETYSQYLSEEASIDYHTLPVVEREWTDTAQGVLRETKGPLDLALAGKGFFTVRSGNDLVYTRNGALRLSAAGQLETADGNPVLGVTGKPIHLDPSLPITVLGDGTLEQDSQVVDRMAIVELPNGPQVHKRESGYFQLLDASLQPAQASQAELKQGMLENSNVSAPESAVRLVAILRQYETLQRALSLAGEMNQSAIGEVAKVSS